MSCVPPQGVHDTWCPGSFSIGGDITTDYRSECSEADYDDIHRLSQQFVQNWPAKTDTCDVCRIVDTWGSVMSPWRSCFGWWSACFCNWT
jgi:hypothetical protein